MSVLLLLKTNRARYASVASRLRVRLMPLLTFVVYFKVKLGIEVAVVTLSTFRMLSLTDLQYFTEVMVERNEVNAFNL